MIRTEGGFQLKGVGEIVLRVRDIDAMIAFYRRVLGLELLRRVSEDIAFLRVAEGFGGHTQIVGFFRERQPSNFRRQEWAGHDPTRTTLHHFALEIAREEYEPALAHFAGLGIPTDTAVHSWIGWRSIYLRDPEDNTIELVCFDPAVTITRD
jgi:catechol 2,3-dioxygenase-like lactoylglutathione lyase family enzyme